MLQYDGTRQVTPEFLASIKIFREEWHKQLQGISGEETPKVDGVGQKIIRHREDGYDYVIEAWMRNRLDKYFPGWSWEMGGPPQFLSIEWVFVWGTLTIIDEHLLAFHIIPPVRKFSATNGTRIKFKIGAEHIAANVIDIGNDVASANSDALKKAINQLCHICDDIYGKYIEENGAGTYETQLETNPDANTFSTWVNSHHGALWSEVCKILDVSSIDEIKDFNEAREKLKTAKGW